MLKAFEGLAQHAGDGFLSGQGIAFGLALYHALKHAPEGSRKKDLAEQFRTRSLDNGIKMAVWSALNGIIEPVIHNNIKNEQIRTAISGAATGAVMNLRNGLRQIATNAASGAAQSIAMSLFSNSVDAVFKPLSTYQMDKLTKQFKKDRNAAVFLDPLTAISKTLGK